MYKPIYVKKNNGIMTNISHKNDVSPSLFTKKINTNYKLVPFNISVNDVGRTKYLPPVAKE